MITQTKKGGRRVDLFLPFSVGDKKITCIEFGPVTWGHTMDWQAGKYAKSIDLMLDLAQVDGEVLRGLMYPDVERVLTAFMDLLPNEIREDLAAGRVPGEVPPLEIPNEALNEDDTVNTPINEPFEEQQQFDFEEPQPSHDELPDEPMPPELAMEEHPDYTKPENFKREEWDAIFDPVRKKSLPADNSAKDPADTGFDLSERS